MAEAPKPPTAPSGVSATWTAVTANSVGTAQVRWTNHSGGTYVSYARLDVFVRSKSTPSQQYVLATIQPYTGQVSWTSSARNGWSASVQHDWQVMVRASASGLFTDSSWVDLPRLQTPKVSVSSVVRTAADRATAYFSVPGGGLAAPTSVHISRALKGQSAGSTTSVNNRVMPVQELGAPLPNAQTEYDLRLRFHGPAGWGDWTSPYSVGPWWQRPDAVTNLAATRLASERSRVRLTWQHTGTGGKAATSYRVERSLDGQVWTGVGSTTAREYTLSLGLASTSRYRVMAVNAGGSSSPVQVTVETWWQPVPGATDLSASRTAEGQIQLDWTVSGLTARNPIRSILVQRAPLLSGDFQTVATLAADRRDWIDTSTTITSQHRYRVVTRGDLGEANSVPTVTVRTGMNVPDAPSSVTVARSVSNPDTLEISFSPRSTSDKPTIDVRLKARRMDGSISNATGWVPLSSLTTHVLIHAAGPNQVLQYAVEARNAAGVSEALTWTDPWATTPRGAVSLIARRTGPHVTLTWTVDGDTTATGWQIERSPDGGQNRYPLPLLQGGAARQAVHQNAAYTVAHEYWIRPVREGAPDAAWVRASTVIPIGAKPDAPLPVAKPWTPDGEPLTLGWVHKSVDGTPQAEAHVELSVHGSAACYLVAGDQQVWTAEQPASVHDFEYEWRVRTRGTGSGEWSDWSDTQYTQVGNRPRVRQLDVPATVESQQLRGSLNLFSGWLSATVQLLDADGNLVAERTLTPATGTNFTFPVQDRHTYTVSAVVHDGRLESLPETATVTVAWARPPAPSLTAHVKGETVRLDVEIAFGLRAVAFAYRPARRRPWGGRLPRTYRVHGAWMDVWEMSNASEQTIIHPRPPEGFPAAAGLDQQVSWLRVYNPKDEPRVVGVKNVNPGVVHPDVLIGAGGSVWIEMGDTVPLVLTNAADLMILDAVTILSDEPAPPRISAAIPGLAFPGATVPGQTEPNGPNHIFDGTTVEDGYTHGWLADQVAYRAVEAASGDEVTPALPGGAVRVEVLRITDGAEHVLGEVRDGTAWDMWPRFCQPDTYVARAYAASGAWQDSDPVSVTVHQRDVVVNAGPGLSIRVDAGPRPNLPVTGGTVETAVRQLVGRRYPTEFVGTTRSPLVVGPVTLKLWRQHSALAEWVAAHNAAATSDPTRPLPALFRDPSGLILHGILDVATRDHRHHLDREVTVMFTETRPRP